MTLSQDINKRLFAWCAAYTCVLSNGPTKVPTGKIPCKPYLIKILILADKQLNRHHHMHLLYSKSTTSDEVCQAYMWCLNNSPHAQSWVVVPDISC